MSHSRREVGSTGPMNRPSDAGRAGFTPATAIATLLWNRSTRSNFQFRISNFHNVSAFTLVEMLTVIGIVAILMGLFFIAATAARKRAHIAVAKSEIREVAKAWNAYWMAYEEWPAGYSGSNVQMTAEAVKILMGHPDKPAGSNPQGLRFLDVGPEAIDDGFEDPWGQLYRVDLLQASAGGEYYETTVHMAGRKRYDYE